MSNYTPGDRTDRVIGEKAAARRRYEESPEGIRDKRQAFEDRVSDQMKIIENGGSIAQNDEASLEAWRRITRQRTGGDRPRNSGRH